MCAKPPHIEFWVQNRRLSEPKQKKEGVGGKKMAAEIKNQLYIKGFIKQVNILKIIAASFLTVKEGIWKLGEGESLE